MKIGILTQPLRTNYGGTLQNYALQTVLKKMGHEPITIDPVSYVYKKDIKFLLKVIKRIFYKLKGSKKYWSINPQVESDMRVNMPTHRRFIDRYIDFISEDYPLQPIITDKNKFEAYIVGSDQVWRPLYQTDLGSCVLDFTKHQQVKRISYAASFGVDKWEIPEKQSRMMKEYLMNFDLLTVREASGVKLCHDHWGISAIHVLDPTMLLTAEQYKELLPVEPNKFDGEVLVYILDINDEKKAIVDKICEQLSKKAFYIGKLEKGIYPSIESWLSGFNQAEFVITDSFHGTVFSIIFEKNFITIGNKQRGMSRLYSLLKMFGIENRMMLNVQKTVCSDIDYTRVYTVLNEKRRISFDLLNKVLNKQA